jgi:hypothetical protein
MAVRIAASKRRHTNKMLSDDSKSGDPPSSIVRELQLLNQTLTTLTAHVRAIAEASKRRAGPKRRVRSASELTDEELKGLSEGKDVPSVTEEELDLWWSWYEPPAPEELEKEPANHRGCWWG